MLTNLARVVEMTNFSLKMNYLDLSHSLRMPLTQILGTVEILETSRLNQAQRTDIDAIRHAGMELLQIVDHILAKCSKDNIDLKNLKGLFSDASVTC